MNRRLVLETVINDGPLSRAAISKKLGVTKATISAIVQDLLEEQYIEEIGSDQTVVNTVAAPAAAPAQAAPHAASAPVSGEKVLSPFPGLI